MYFSMLLGFNPYSNGMKIESKMKEAGYEWDAESFNPYSNGMKIE